MTSYLFFLSNQCLQILTTGKNRGIWDSLSSWHKQKTLVEQSSRIVRSGRKGGRGRGRGGRSNIHKFCTKATVICNYYETTLQGYIPIGQAELSSNGRIDPSRDLHRFSQHLKRNSNEFSFLFVILAPLTDKFTSRLEWDGSYTLSHWDLSINLRGFLIVVALHNLCCHHYNRHFIDITLVYKHIPQLHTQRVHSLAKSCSCVLHIVISHGTF